SGSKPSHPQSTPRTPTKTIHGIPTNATTCGTGSPCRNNRPRQRKPRSRTVTTPPRSPTMPETSQANDLSLAMELARWRAQILHSPQRFRESLRLAPDDARLFAETITPWQAHDFAALD